MMLVDDSFSGRKGGLPCRPASTINHGQQRMEVVMQTKACFTCKTPKPINDFIKSKKSRDGLERECRGCHSKRAAKWYKNNAVKARAKIALYRKKHPGKGKEALKQWMRDNPEKTRQYKRKWAKNNPEKIRIKNQRYRLNNLEKHRQNQRAWQKKNRDKFCLYSQRWRRAHKEQARLSSNRTGYKKYHNNPLFRLMHLQRVRIARILKRSGERKTSRTLKYLGCSTEQLKLHIEQQFKPNMTWENHSIHGWHVDHIKPLAAFDLTDPEQQQMAFHYSNLQPMWAMENIKKGSIYHGT